MSSSFRMRWRPALGVLVLGSIAIGLGVKGAAAEKARVAARDKSKDAPQAGVVSTPRPVSSVKSVSVPRGTAATESKALDKNANLPEGAVAVPTVVNGVVQPSNWVDPDAPANFTGVEALIGQAPTFGDVDSIGSVAAGTTGACCLAACGGCVANQTQAACLANPGATFQGLKSLCADDICGCLSRACCNGLGTCVGDQTRSVCEGAGNRWNSAASCVGAGNRPLPICNQFAANNCSWDNGLPLNDGGASRAHTHSGGAGQLPRYDMSSADDFILGGPDSNPCQIGTVNWWFRARPSDTTAPVFTPPDPPNDIIGMNVTVYRNMVHTQTGINQPAGQGVEPANADDLNPKISNTPGGVVYTRTFFGNTGDIDYSSTIGCDPPPAIGQERAEIWKAEITIDPPILLNKNVKYWLDVQGLFPFNDGLRETLQTHQIPSQNNSLLTARGYRTSANQYFPLALPSTACTMDSQCAFVTAGFCSPVDSLCHTRLWEPIGPGFTQGGNQGAPAPCQNVPAGSRVDMAFSLVGVKDNVAVPGNDLCADAVEAFDGVTPFDNTAATTEPGLLGCVVERDVWFTYAATCAGVVTAKTCDSTGNTAIAIYENLGCAPVATLLDCDSATCGNDGSVQAVGLAGGQYLIRVGGDALTDFAKGSLMIECEPTCGVDDGDLMVNNCCIDHSGDAPPGNLGCENDICCQIVCDTDGEEGCCNELLQGWDLECSQVAAETPACNCPCAFTCPGLSQNETEACAANTNGGCNNLPSTETFEPLGALAVLPATKSVCGTLQAASNSRDTDWWLGTLPDTASGLVTMNLVANGSAPVALLVFTRFEPAGVGETFCTDKVCSNSNSCQAAVPCADDSDCNDEDPLATCLTVGSTLLGFDSIATASCQATDGDPCAALITCLPDNQQVLIVAVTAEADGDCNVGDGIFNGITCGGQDDYSFTITLSNDCADGACCTFTGGCRDGSGDIPPAGPALNEYECFLAGGSFAGEGVTCEALPIDINCADLGHGCAAAPTIVCGQTVTVDLTTDDHLPEEGYPCGADGNDPNDRAWYKFVAPCVDDNGNGVNNPDNCNDQAGPDTTSVRVNTCNSTNPGRDSLLAVFGSCCVGGLCPSGAACDDSTLCGGACSAAVDFSVAGCSDDECGFTDFLSDICAQDLIEGETYYVEISNWAEPVNGLYQLTLTCPCLGSCCDSATAVCTDGVAADACDEPLRFETQNTCSQLVPACGIGACCRPDGTCVNATLAGCSGANENHNPGAACSTIVCNVFNNCSYNTGDPNDCNADASFGFRTQYRIDTDIYTELADDFELKGSVGNGCEVSSISYGVFHTSHDTLNGCQQGGGVGCADSPVDYDGIIVTISEDTAGDEKGPTCLPECTSTECQPGPDSDYHDDENIDGCYSYAFGEAHGEGPIPSGNYWTFETFTNCGGQAQFVITLHFQPPLDVEKNKKNWLAITHVVPQLSRYSTIWFASADHNGNVSRAYSSAGTLEFEPLEAFPNDQLFDISGLKVAPGCGVCELFGDIAPLPAVKCNVDVDDILCALDSFSVVGICGAGNLGDITQPGGVCGPSGDTDVDDILAVLASFSGSFSCPSPCPPGACVGDFTGPPAGTECRDGDQTGSFFVGNGMSESDCFNLTGGTGMWCDPGSVCITNSTCTGP